MPETDKLWEIVSALQQNHASITQSVSDIKGMVEMLTKALEKNLDRSHEKEGAQDILIAEFGKDADALAEKIRDTEIDMDRHKENHKWWVVTVIAVVGTLVAIFEAVNALFKKPPY